MIVPRCTKCFKRLGEFAEIHVCPAIAVPKKKRAPKPKDPTPPAERKPARAPRPSGRSRSEYLAAVAASHGTLRQYRRELAAKTTGGPGPCEACKAANYAAVQKHRQATRAATA